VASCDSCGTVILFGGKRDGDLRFCNDRCQSEGFLVTVSAQLPEDVVRQQVMSVHQGQCPRCGGSGPVDVHTHYKVWSALITTSWSNVPQVSCRRCGWGGQLKALVFSLVAGWWGFPWGLLMTPVQMARNLAAMGRKSDPYQPSPELEKAVRLMLAQRAVEEAALTTTASR
jgi:hypothetical protein